MGSRNLQEHSHASGEMPTTDVTGSRVQLVSKMFLPSVLDMGELAFSCKELYVERIVSRLSLKNQPTKLVLRSAWQLPWTA